MHGLFCDGRELMPAGEQEFHENETITVDKVELSQSVNIFGCKGATILIKGKVNAVNISTCTSFHLASQLLNT